MRAATAEERKALGVPPAYTDVRVSTDPKAELIATATTPNGKTYYKYSAEYVARRTEEKYARIAALDVKEVVAKLQRDLRTTGPKKHLAMTARLIFLTGMRIGNPGQGDVPSFGASSLLTEHLTFIDESTVRLRFPGKHGVLQDVVVSDVAFATYAWSRRGEARLFPHKANAVLRYLKRIGVPKAHDIRTFRAGLLATRLASTLEQPTTKKGAKAFKKTVATAVASMLGNKPGQALKSYIDPATWEDAENE